jgi:hypothetical protein
LAILDDVATFNDSCINHCRPASGLGRRTTANGLGYGAAHPNHARYVGGKHWKDIAIDPTKKISYAGMDSAD